MKLKEEDRKKIQDFRKTYEAKAEMVKDISLTSLSLVDDLNENFKELEEKHVNLFLRGELKDKEAKIKIKEVCKRCIESLVVNQYRTLLLSELFNLRKEKDLNTANLYKDYKLDKDKKYNVDDVKGEITEMTVNWT